MGFFLSAFRRYGAHSLGPVAEQILYRWPADTNVMLSPYKSCCICIGGPPIWNSLLNDSNGWTVVSAGRRYQGTLVIKFISFMSYRRPADTVGIQRDRCVHLHFIGGLRCSVGGSDLLGPVSSSAIGRSIPRIGGLSEHPLSHDSADTVASANTTLPRCALELTQMNWSDIPISVRTKKLFANPSY